MRSSVIIASLFAAANAGVIHRACQEPDVVQNFDTDAYLGLWYEIYRDEAIRYEHGTCTTASYAKNDDGSLKVLNNDYIESEQKWGGGIGRATFVDPSKDDGYL